MLGKIVVSANVNNEDKFFFVLLLNFIRSILLLVWTAYTTNSNLYFTVPEIWYTA